MTKRRNATAVEKLPDECCNKCRFMLPTAPNEGVCRRYPATVVAAPTGGCMALFPPMLNAGWCGEFAPIPVPN